VIKSREKMHDEMCVQFIIDKSREIKHDEMCVQLGVDVDVVQVVGRIVGQVDSALLSQSRVRNRMCRNWTSPAHELDKSKFPRHHATLGTKADLLSIDSHLSFVTTSK
jgi:hypothetical protein